MASTIGTPLFVDACTTNQHRISYARILIEINVTKNLPTEVTVMDPSGRQFQQRKKEQEGQPLKRRKPTKIVQTWVAKRVIQQQSAGSLGMSDQQEVAGILLIDKGKAAVRGAEGEWSQPKSKGNSLRQRTEYQKAEAEKNERNEGHKDAMANSEGVYAVSKKNGFQAILMHEKGINKRYKQKKIKKYLIENHIKIAGLVETKVKENNAQHIVGKIACTWSLLNNYGDASNGRIWIMWDSRIYNIKKLASQVQYIQCHIIGKHNGVDFLIAVVYGFNTMEQRKTLWSQLNYLASGINKPLVNMWRFQCYTYPQDRHYGVPVTLAEIKDCRLLSQSLSE
uniref:Uncharacterized protein n=1 Tax=Nicotiana tabacum TaxID=4097 RepID=A0A1S4CN05_TOBAC|nr:PREDICTED: uncharacterized protein LOC107820630 [Nicotiana tabacum]